MIGLVTQARALRPAIRVLQTSDGTARLLAAGAACACALLAEALLGGSGLSARQIVLVLVSIALWSVLVSMGFRIGVLAKLAAPAFIVFLAYELAATSATLQSLTGIRLSSPDRTRWYLGSFVVVAVLPLLMVLVSMATKTGRRLRGVLLAAGLAATAALVWPVPIFIAVAAAPASQGMLLMAAALALPTLLLAPVFGWLEVSRGMRAAEMVDARDSLMRVSGGTAGLLAALWAASMAGSPAARHLAGTPLEGLVLPVAWCTGGVVVASVLLVLWRAPRALYRGQVRGRFYPRAISDAIWFLLLASATGTLIDLAAGGSMLGWVSWIALASAAGYGLVRVGTAAPLAHGVSPLWIVVLQRPPWSGRAVVNRLASAWKIGPVTIVAPPDAAPVIAGAHLRASAASGRLHHLFPLRSSHLVDWDDSLPPPSSWHALPVREIYARTELWAETLGRRVTPDSVVVAVNPWPSYGGRSTTILKLLWRNVAGVLGLSGAAVKPSDAARLRPTMSAEELAALSTNETFEASLSGLKAVQKARPGATRHILVLHHHHDRDLAVSVCEALAGRIDRAGMTIQSWALPLDAAVWGPGLLWSVPVGFWSHAFALARRLLDRSGREITWIGRLWSVALRSLAARAERTPYDIAVLEPAGAAVAKGPLHDFFSGIVEHVEPPGAIAVGVVEQVIALRPLGQEVTPTFDPRRYTGEIRWAQGLTAKARADEIANRVLEVSHTPVREAERPREAPAPAPQPVDTPVAATPVSTPAAAPVDAADETPLDVYIALTPDVADFRGPLMDAFDHRRDMRRTISILGRHASFDPPTTAGFSLSQEIVASLEAGPTFDESPAEARARLEHADIYVLVLGSSLHEVQGALKTVRNDLREARRRLVPCLVFQRRAERDPADQSSSEPVAADTFERALELLHDLNTRYSVEHFRDFRELLSLLGAGIERVRHDATAPVHAAAASPEAPVAAPVPVEPGPDPIRLLFAYDPPDQAEAQELLRELRLRFQVDENRSSQLDEAKIEQSDAVVLLTGGYWSDPARLEARARAAGSLGKPAVAVSVSQPATPLPPWIRNANDHRGTRAYLRTPDDSALDYSQRRRVVQQITENLWYILLELISSRGTTGSS